MDTQFPVIFLKFFSGKNKENGSRWARVEYATMSGDYGQVYLSDPDDDDLIDRLSDLKPFDQVTLSLSLTPSSKGWRAALDDILRKEV